MGIVLHVMSGDQVSIRASSWYKLNGGSPETPQNPLNDLLAALSNGIFSANGGAKFTAAQLQGTGLLTPGMQNLLDQQTSTYTSTKPKAFLNWILFDEQFKLVSSSSGFEQVGADEVFTTWVKPNLPINKNGYFYVYTSNESPVDVFFDNLQVTHVRGPLLEETHYYPFGLTMAGISSKAAGKLENRYKYNGIELDEDLGVEAYEAKFRTLDPQRGVWWQIDPKIEEGQESISPYAAMANDPVLKSDPLGDVPTSGGDDPNKKGFLQGVVDGAKGFVNGIVGAISNPKQAYQNMVVQGYLNVAATAASGGMIRPDVVQDVRTISTEGAYGLGKVVGRETTGLVVAAATDGALKAVGNALKVEIPQVKGLPDEATVVRGGMNSPSTIAAKTDTHPSGVTGVSVNCGSCSVKELSAGLPQPKVGVTTVGAVRKAGGDVIKTSGRSPFHATLTGLPPEKTSQLLNPAIKNPNIP